jgi:lipopolysaccharide/colanic/teichoic acid biosynthesis glycosyltransferase
MVDVYARWGKRLLDIFLSSAGLLFLSPLLVFTAFCIWLEDRKTSIFRQERVGRNEAPFTMLKFRSMPIGAENLPSARAPAPAVTRVGRVIRRSSLDELPQLTNVVRGDMSLVGPRPALPTQVELIRLRQNTDAVCLRPGLTGLAQIRSYDGMPDDRKAAHDVEYAEQISFMNDLNILAKTAAYLLRPPPRY